MDVILRCLKHFQLPVTTNGEVNDGSGMWGNVKENTFECNLKGFALLELFFPCDFIFVCVIKELHQSLEKECDLKIAILSHYY